MNPQKLADIRREYERDTLNPEDLPDNPLQTFVDWFELAVNEVESDANAMVLATIEDNKPVSRVVLLKECTDRGLVFFTNYLSRKGRNLEGNPNASLCFYWAQLERQIRVEGKVEKISPKESDLYFKSRPRLSQAGAIASEQSKEIESRETLEHRMSELMELPESELKRPEHWGGYVLLPEYLEFWQGREGRLHDRICYENLNGNWRKFRISP